MHCVNHPELNAQSYCQHCGKALCSSCLRTAPGGQIYCEGCLAATGGDPTKAYWQAATNFVTPPPGSPNPALAAVLGLIPGVGAMYNGQLFKGLIHVVVFAVLVSITHQFGIFGIFVGAWILYQSFEAFQTAKARRDGLPIPDPFGLNEVGAWLNLSGLGLNPQSRPGAVPPPPPSSPPPPPPAAVPGTPEPPPYSAPYSASYSSGWSGGMYQPPQQTQYSEPFTGEYPPGSVPPIPPIPPIPPLPPYNWRRREPVWAIVMIALGIIFLLQSMGFVEHLFRYSWPVLLIGIGVWLIVRRVGYTQGGPK